MGNGVNDRPNRPPAVTAHQGMGAQQNLIPIHPLVAAPYSAHGCRGNVKTFSKRLLTGLGVNSTFASTLGNRTISAACGHCAQIQKEVTNRDEILSLKRGDMRQPSQRKSGQLPVVGDRPDTLLGCRVRRFAVGARGVRLGQALKAV